MRNREVATSHDITKCSAEQVLKQSSYCDALWLTLDYFGSIRIIGESCFLMSTGLSKTLCVSVLWPATECEVYNLRCKYHFQVCNMQPHNLYACFKSTDSPTMITVNFSIVITTIVYDSTPHGIAQDDSKLNLQHLLHDVILQVCAFLCLCHS